MDGLKNAKRDSLLELAKALGCDLSQATSRTKTGKSTPITKDDLFPILMARVETIKPILQAYQTGTAT